MKHFHYNKIEADQLARDEFIQFWADVYALFDSIDKNKGLLRIDSISSINSVPNA